MCTLQFMHPWICKKLNMYDYYFMSYMVITFNFFKPPRKIIKNISCQGFSFSLAASNNFWQLLIVVWRETYKTCWNVIEVITMPWNIYEIILLARNGIYHSMDSIVIWYENNVEFYCWVFIVSNTFQRFFCPHN